MDGFGCLNNLICIIHLSPSESSWENQTNTAELAVVVFPNYRANQEL
jgi:hypothetical protein